MKRNAVVFFCEGFIFQASLGKFEQKSFTPSKISLLLHLCYQFLALFLLGSFSLFIVPDGITGFGVALAKLSLFLFFRSTNRLIKIFVADDAMTCGVINGLDSFICLWCNAATVNIGIKVRFPHTLHFMTKQRCSSASATTRLHQKFGIIDSSVATCDILTWHRMWCPQINFWCLMLRRKI